MTLLALALGPDWNPIKKPVARIKQDCTSIAALGKNPITPRTATTREERKDDDALVDSF